jgi:hypothetical protein
MFHLSFNCLAETFKSLHLIYIVGVTSFTSKKLVFEKLVLGVGGLG